MLPIVFYCKTAYLIHQQLFPHLLKVISNLFELSVLIPYLMLLTTSPSIALIIRPQPLLTIVSLVASQLLLPSTFCRPILYISYCFLLS